MRGRRKVTRFWRGPRRQPRWDLGTPPGKRKRHLADPVVYLRLIIVVSVAGLIVLPSLADALSGMARPAQAEFGECRVVQVIDGDTVTVWCPARGIERARLLGFDTPELFSPGCLTEWARAYGAMWRLRWMIWTAGELRTVRSGTDRYGRGLVSLFLDGRDVRHAMIGAGAARAYDGGARGSWCA